MAEKMPDLSDLSDTDRAAVFKGAEQLLTELDKIAPARPPGYVGIPEAEDMLTNMSSAASAVPVKALSSSPSVYSVTNPDHIITVNDPAAISAVNHGVRLDAAGHVIPGPDAETLGQALAKLPSDAMSWFTDWFDGFDLTGPLMALTHTVTGIAPWLTVALLGIKIIDMGGKMINKPRAPVDLAQYKMATPAAEPVAKILTNQGVEVRGTQPVTETMSVILIPMWHTGVADRALARLKASHNLQYEKLAL